MKTERNKKRPLAESTDSERRETVTFEPSKPSMGVLNNWKKTGYDRTMFLNALVSRFGQQMVDELPEQLKQVGILPKTNPCPSLKSNALTSLDASSNFAASTDGVLAQLVEHHNGIELASASKSSPKVCNTNSDNIDGVVKLGPNLFGVVAKGGVDFVTKEKLPKRKLKELSLCE